VDENEEKITFNRDGFVGPMRNSLENAYRAMQEVSSALAILESNKAFYSKDGLEFFQYCMKEAMDKTQKCINFLLEDKF
jgi:hypothetical protein